MKVTDLRWLIFGTTQFRFCLARAMGHLFLKSSPATGPSPPCSRSRRFQPRWQT